MSEITAPAAPIAAADAAPVETTPATPQVDESIAKRNEFADRLELLTRKERAFYREKQRITQEKQALAAQKAEFEKWQQAKAKAKENPLDYLSQANLDYDTLTSFMLNGGKPTPQDEIKSIKDEFEAFKRAQLEEKEQMMAEQKKIETMAQQRAQAQILQNFQEEIDEFLTANATNYELITTREAGEEVFSTIQNAFRISMNDWLAKGRRGPKPAPMSIQEAADIVEGFYEQEIERLTKTQKLQSKFGAAQPGQKPKGPSPTLNNQMTSSAAPSLLPAKNEADRMARALAKLTE